MWVMIITLLAYADPAQLHFSPAVASVTFKSKATCEAASKAYTASMKPVTDQVDRTIADGRKVGQFVGPNGVMVSALCTLE